MNFRPSCFHSSSSFISDFFTFTVRFDTKEQSHFFSGDFISLFGRKWILKLCIFRWIALSNPVSDHSALQACPSVFAVRSMRVAEFVHSMITRSDRLLDQRSQIRSKIENKTDPWTSVTAYKNDLRQGRFLLGFCIGRQSLP